MRVPRKTAASPSLSSLPRVHFQHSFPRAFIPHVGHPQDANRHPAGKSVPSSPNAPPPSSHSSRSEIGAISNPALRSLPLRGNASRATCSSGDYPRFIRDKGAGLQRAADAASARAARGPKRDGFNARLGALSKEAFNSARYARHAVAELRSAERVTARVFVIIDMLYNAPYSTRVIIPRHNSATNSVST